MHVQYKVTNCNLKNTEDTVWQSFEHRASH